MKTLSVVFLLLFIVISPVFSDLPKMPFLAVLKGEKPQPKQADISTAWYWVSHNISFKLDMDNYGVSDYWASPQETLKRGCGDCEDYCLLLKYKLSLTGVDSKMVLIVRGGEYHAILLVNGQYIEPQVYGMTYDNPKIEQVYTEKYIQSKIGGKK